MSNIIETDPPLIRIFLYGPLAAQFGSRHEFAVRNPREAAAALAANYSNFATAFRRYQHYHIIADGDLRDGDEAAGLPVGSEIHFLPKVEGNAFLGGALIGALFPSIAGTAAASIIGGVLFAGVAIGLSLLLRPKQEQTDEPERRAATGFAFTGPENVTDQGVAVPLVYGRVMCGSVVISAGLSTADEPLLPDET